MQCQGIVKNGSRCSRPKGNAQTNSNYCWQHQDQPKEESTEGKFDSSGNLIFNLNEDVELLMYSYLPLEEILTIFRDDIATRDKIIRLYFKELPDIDDASRDGDIEVVKYLYQKGIRATNHTMNLASENGHLNIVKFLYENGIMPTSYTINSAIIDGHLDIVKYLYEKGVKPWAYTVNRASGNGYLEVVKYLYENGFKPTGDAIGWASAQGHLEVVKYLVEKGIRPSSDAIDLATRYKYLDVVKYLESKMN